MSSVAAAIENHYILRLTPVTGQMLILFKGKILLPVLYEAQAIICIQYFTA